jgi:hypothetical protein
MRISENFTVFQSYIGLNWGGGLKTNTNVRIENPLFMRYPWGIKKTELLANY